MRFLALLIGIPMGAVLFSLGCAGVSPVSQTLVAITDVKSVSGKWEGVLKRVPPARHEEWVEATIEETGLDTGIVEYASYQTAGVFAGKRPLKIVEGQIASEGERGSATFTLYESSAGQELRVHVMMRDGTKYDARLSRSRK